MTTYEKSKNSVKVFLWLLTFLLFPFVALAVSPDAYEDDNSLSQAKLILPNDSDGPQHHNFHNANDADWAKFYGIAGRNYVIKASNLGTDCDVALELYDRAGNKLAGPIDDYGKGQEEYFEWKCPVNGFY